MPSTQTCRSTRAPHSDWLGVGVGNEHENFLGFLVSVERCPLVAGLLCKEVAKEWEKFVIATSNLFRL
jgi:hypothetical protein